MFRPPAARRAGAEGSTNSLNSRPVPLPPGCRSVTRGDPAFGQRRGVHARPLHSGAGPGQPGGSGRPARQVTTASSRPASLAPAPPSPLAGGLLAGGPKPSSATWAHPDRARARVRQGPGEPQTGPG